VQVHERARRPLTCRRAGQGLHLHLHSVRGFTARAAWETPAARWAMAARCRAASVLVVGGVVILE
jgi:hypothetical protein